jgi:hypothetical protein
MGRLRTTSWPALLIAAGAVVAIVAAVSIAWALSDSGTGKAPHASAAAASAASEPPTLAPSTAPTRAPDPLTGAAAVAAARVAAPESAERPAVSVVAGPVGELIQPLEAYEWSTELEPERWVWVVVLLRGDGLDAQGSTVVIDYLDGRVYAVMHGRG